MQNLIKLVYHLVIKLRAFNNDRITAKEWAAAKATGCLNALWRQIFALDSAGFLLKVSKGAKIRSGYNQVPHPTQDTNWKVTNSELDTTNESQEVSPFPAGDHKAQINRRAQRHNKHKTEQNIKDPQKKYRLGTVSKIFYWRA